MNKKLEKRLNEIDINIKDILKKIELNSQESVVMYSSHIEGLGTDESDLDIYVICKEIPIIKNARRTPYSVVQIAFINNVKLDIEYLTYETVKKLLNKLQSGKSLTNEEVKILNRLKVGEYILKNEHQMKLMNEIEKNKLNEHLKNYFIVNSNSEEADAVTMYKANNLNAAISCARRALDYSVGAFNCNSGYTNPNVKWIPKIFIEYSSDSDLREEYLNLQIFSKVTKENIREQIEAILSLRQEIISSLLF